MPYRSKIYQPLPRPSVIAVISVFYGAVLVALTMLKAFYRIGGLWIPQRQRVRDFSLLPWDNALGSQTLFAALFDTVGNVALFLPVGFLAVIALWHSRHRLGLALLIGVGLSLSVELMQYIFALGRSDTGDLLTNALGTWLGGSLACHRWLHRLGIALIALAIGAFVLIFALAGGAPK